MENSMRLLTVLCGLACAAPAAAAQSPAATPAPQVTVTGVAYTQFVYQLADTAAHANSFDVTRAYLNALGKFAGGVSTRLTADIYRQAGDNSLRYRLKYAFIAYTPQASPLTFKLGQIHTPWVDWEEALWDYRMQGTVALDRNGYLSSSDFGFGIDGKWSTDRVNLSAAIINGENYNGGTGDQRKDVAARVSVRLVATSDSSRVGGLRLSGYGHIGKPTGGGTRNRAVGMVSYRSRQLTLAVEYAVTRDSSATTTALLRGRVISVYGAVRLPKSQAALIGRFDSVDPNTGVTGDRQNRMIAGVSYQLTPNVRLLGDWDRLSYQSTPTPAQEAVRSQALLQAQFAF
jgi:Phosphate-selective porin O and P